MHRILCRLGELRESPNEQQDFVRGAKGCGQGLEFRHVVAAGEQNHHRLGIPDASEQRGPRGPVADDRPSWPTLGQ
eukprot:10609645-Alexandrium_andersonii.AAC.1